MPQISVSISTATGTNINTSGTVTDPEVLAAARLIFDHITDVTLPAPNPEVAQ